MATIGKKILERRLELGMSQDELAHHVGYKDRSSIAKIESGERDIRQKKVIAFAEALQTTPQWLMGYGSETKPNAKKLPNDFIRMIPVFESVSAGFGANAENRVLDFIPLFIQSDTEAANTICVRVCGDSMHPQIQDGDLVQVHKQETAETGDIVVILDGDDAYVKRFIRTPQGITLESFNPNYPPMRFNREESNCLRIVGIVKRIVRDL
jgi:repressor LexA